jgi:serine/threonine-protein kinase RsbW
MSTATELWSDGGPSPFVEVVLNGDPAEAHRFKDEMERRLLHSSHASPHDVFGIKLAIDEALCNAIKHGNQMDREKKVRVVYLVSAHVFEVRVSDEGSGFDPSDLPDPTAVENLPRPGGRGLMLMRHYMTEVFYNAAGNCVVMSKALGNGKKLSVVPNGRRR